MLDTPTKKRIDDCRNILVGKLPDPKAQIEQITIGLIYKFMDDMDKEAISLGGKAKFFSGDYKKYSWDSLFDTKVTANEMLGLYSEAIVSMDKNPNIPQLFRDIFKNAYLPYRDPETLKMFLQTIGEFEYTHSEKLGDAFEYLLSVMGSQGDAGQFRTPRHIIDFLVAVVDPGITDTILDPACGTAGFLISAFKHIKEKSKDKAGLVSTITPDERKKLIRNFAGYDISPDMVRLSLVNLYLHGFSDPHISEYDTLSSEERWNDTYDVILANPPFMSPKGGIRPHKRFTISSNRSEVLFVDYIAEHLNPKGRAGIIVPEGVIFQSGGAYKDLRKMLVENYLYAVVSLPAGIFNPYSGVKTSILLMDKELAKTRQEILFVKVANDGYNLGAQRNAIKGGQLADAIEILKKFKADNFIESDIAHTVQKSDLARKGDYNLSGERYNSIIEKGILWDSVALKDIVESTQLGLVKGKPEQGEKSDLHPYPYIKMDAIDWNGQLDLSKVSFVNATDEEIRKSTLDNGDFIYNTRNAPNLVGKCSVYHGKSGEYIFNNNILRIKVNSEKANPDYINRILVSDTGKKQVQSLIAGTTSVAAIYQKEYLSIQIPLPPLSIQEEIVAEIDGYQKIIDGAKMVVSNYKPKIDIDPEWEIEELGKITQLIGGGTPSKQVNEYWENGDIDWVSCSDFTSNSIYLPDSIRKITENGLTNSSSNLIEEGTLVLVTRVSLGKMAFTKKPTAINQDLTALKFNSNKIDKFFGFYYLLSISHKIAQDGNGITVKGINRDYVRGIKIPLPPPETQKLIVAQIEKEQELVNANKLLIEIFEQKIKDRIAKVWGK